MVVLSTASPYKFPAAVLRAVGAEATGDEFEQMEALERLSGVPIPAGLRGLRNKAPLHRDVIEREALLPWLLSSIKEGKT